MANDLNLYSKCSIAKYVNENGEETSEDKAFVGIKYMQDDVQVCFPLGYEIPKDDDECRKSIITLLRTISLSKNIINQEVKLNDQLQEDYAFPMSAYLWLIRDYFTNGIYQSKEKIIKRNSSGKLNWKRMMRETPLLSNGNFIYLEQYSEHNIAVDNIITEIHILCLNEALKRIGFLFGNFELKDSLMTFDNKDFLLNVLNNALSKTFEDHKQQLLINLRNVLLGLDINNSDQSINNYGVNGFHEVWETIVRFLFGNQEISGYTPVATYEGAGIRGNKKKHPLRLDALLLKDGVYYILDAKYYHFGLDMMWNSAPDTTDVEKQVVYGEYVDLKTGHKNDVFNSFIIPYNKYNNPKIEKFNKNIEYVGYATVSWKRNHEKAKPYYYVAVILVDCKFAIDNWTYNNVDSILDEIVKKVNEVKPTIEKYGWTPLPFMTKDGNY